MKIYFITGAPGTGKSTVSENLKRKGIPNIDLDRTEDRITHWRSNLTSDISHWYSGAPSTFFEENSYLVDLEKLKKEINNYHDVLIVTGVSDNQKDFLSMFDKIFFLQCKEETFINRIKKRKIGEFGNHDSEQKMIQGWYKKLEAEMLMSGAIPINSEKPIETVVEEIIRNINN